MALCLLLCWSQTAYPFGILSIHTFCLTSFVCSQRVWQRRSLSVPFEYPRSPTCMHNAIWLYTKQHQRHRLGAKFETKHRLRGTHNVSNGRFPFPSIHHPSLRLSVVSIHCGTGSKPRETHHDVYKSRDLMGKQFIVMLQTTPMTGRFRHTHSALSFTGCPLFPNCKCKSLCPYCIPNHVVCNNKLRELHQCFTVHL